MLICIVSPGMQHDGNTLKTKSLGGSETAAIQLAEALSKIPDKFGNKNRVTVFSPTPEPVLVNDVNYIPIQAAQQYIDSADIDVLIVSRWQEPLMRPTNAKVVLYWCHDLALKRFVANVRGIMYQIDHILLMSQFQKKQYMDVYGLPDEMLEVIRNGIDLNLFPAPNSKKREMGQMVYCARPERGLENLVKPGGIMEQLLAENVPVTLSVAHYDNTTKEAEPYYNYLWGRCNELPNVRILGSLTKRQLYDLYSRSWLYLYPTDFEEISCISAMEAMACGLPFLTTPTAALVETLDKDAAVFIDGPAASEESQKRFVEEIKILASSPNVMSEMSLAGYKAASLLGWGPVAEQIVEVADRVMRQKSSNPARLYKHFLRMSDIEMCKAMGDVENAESEVRYVRENFSFTESPTAYREHYEKVDGPIDEINKGASVGHYDGSENEPRWLVLKKFVQENAAKFKTVLDYGCWIGHQTIRIANELPNATVVGVDVNARNIELAKECKGKHSHRKNVDFTVYDEMTDSGPQPATGFYDLVVCNEVLEHVVDPYALIEKLERFCKPGGTIFITTPYGPWEYESFKTFPYRCHIRHYEMNDLLDVFGEKENLQAYYRGVGMSSQGLPLGHQYIVYTNNPDRPTGKVNLIRKMAYQAPRETLSVCLIAYNAEDMLHRCLKSVSNIADEIIIAIDPKTTDSTREIAASYGAKIIDGVDPIKEGFETARNNSIAGAKGDWILWIDSDEELLQSENVYKYLRQNHFNGYAVQQHHMSVDPPTALKPDLPIRLFRNGKDIKFFGHVHEHPEIEMNKGIGQGIVLVDTWIAHDGYLTEKIRRSRFLRNIDLVVIDRKKYPERNLGHFLWLRDLIHLTRYRREQLNGQGPDQQCIQWAHEAKVLFEEKFLNEPTSPMLLEAIAYYSEANQLLNLGIPIHVEIKLDGGRDARVFDARFPDSDTAGKFISNLSKAMIAETEGRYI